MNERPSEPIGDLQMRMFEFAQSGEGASYGIFVILTNLGLSNSFVLLLNTSREGTATYTKIIHK